MRTGGPGWLPAVAVLAATLVTGFMIGSGQLAGADPAEADPTEIGSGPPPWGITQPITGPGLPPLPMAGGGPYGSHVFTGYEFAALTFDDGPDPDWTPQVLAALRAYDVRATFCVVGELVVAYPELVRQIAEAGHTLCNHSWDHDVQLGNRSAAEIRSDLVRTNAAILAAAPGARISYYRQPGGAWTPQVVEVAHQLGMSSLHWTVDPQDWRAPDPSWIAATVAGGTGPGGIVLLHDGGGDRGATVAALHEFLPTLTDQVYLDALPPGVAAAPAPGRRGGDPPGGNSPGEPPPDQASG